MGFTEDQVAQIIKMGEDATEAATKVKTVRQLMDTLKESAQSGWTQSWQIIVGDFAEAKELLTKVSDYFGGLIQQSSDARNAILQGWKDGGGRDKIIKAFWDMAEAIEKSEVLRKMYSILFCQKSLPIHSLIFLQKLESLLVSSKIFSRIRITLKKLDGFLKGWPLHLKS